MGYTVDGIILAAGLSTRMGFPKLTVKIGGLSVGARVLAAALGSKLNKVIVVKGPVSGEFVMELGDSASPDKLLQVMNPHPESGMSSSLRIGVLSLSSAAAGAMVILADQPRLTSAVIDELVEAFGKDRQAIVVPTIAGRRTTPVVFPADLFAELLETVGDVGGRMVLNRHMHRVVKIEMGSRYDDIDLDTPEDLDKLKTETGGPREDENEDPPR